MSTLATFISTLGFKMDGSFDQAMLTVNKRLNALGNSLGNTGGQLSKSLDAASKRIQAAQMNLEAQKLKSESARMAASDKQYAAELKRINSISNTEEKLAATKALNAERFRAKERSHVLDMEKISTRGALEREKLALRTRQQEHREEQARIRRVGGSGSSGMGLGAFGGIPVMGRTTLGMMAGGFGISELARQSYQIANYQASRKPTFEFITKDANEATQNIQYLDAEVKRLSLNLITANKDYITLFASGYKALGSKGTQELFTGFQEIATMMNLGEDAQHRGLLALGQMMSKGKVQAEELNFRLAA